MVIRMDKNDTYWTRDNLTDEVIDQLRNEAIDVDDTGTAALCDIALHGKTRMRDAARRLIAEHLNAVKALENDK